MTDFASLLQPDRGQSARTITLLTPETFDAWLNRQSAATRALATAQHFTAKPGTHVLIPDGDGIAVAAGVADASSPWALAKLAEALPEGSYRLDGVEVGANALGWLLGQYRFTRYRKAEDAAPRVLLTRDVAHRDEIIRIAAATAQVRDLVNSGAGDLGPAELEAEAQMLARAHHADVTVISGEALARDYPMIHAVGQAAIRERAPRLIELHWGDTSHPRIAIVGKGVCFDTGGLDIKPSAGMRLMKKDMGGAAHALALAGLVMAAKLP
ncbi:MAG TPA: leucyl aminopeptidase family protein, partial [Sphingomonas sanguinis]|nr:leucyl aminopeptidase family protein [Sphingomonas sanguinis]